MSRKRVCHTKCKFVWQVGALDPSRGLGMGKRSRRHIGGHRLSTNVCDGLAAVGHPTLDPSSYLRVGGPAPRRISNLSPQECRRERGGAGG